LEANGLKADQAGIEDEALRLIIKGYTREAGVRSLEREIGKALRHAAVQIAKAPHKKVTIGTNDLTAVLGQPRFEGEIALRTSVPGVATGLAWTPVGGDILFIEATRVPGKGSLILTGQLGDVMRESAQAALTPVKSRASQLGIDPSDFREERHSRPCARGRHAEGWTERRCRDVHRAGFAAHGPHGQERHRDDGRDIAARYGAAGRRHQGEGRRGRRRRPDQGDAAGTQPARF
jgi:hypothetical protein